MQTVFISGNLGRDAELRRTQSGDDVLSFSVAVKQGWGDKASSNWFRCNVWGKRASSLQQHLLKGVRVVVSGELTIGEYQGKTQFDVRVADVEFMSRGEQLSGGGARQQTRAAVADDLDDDVPFVTCDPAYEHRRRRII